MNQQVGGEFVANPGARRLLLITDRWEKDKGVRAELARSLAEGCARLGWAVTVLMPGGPFGHRASCSIEGVTVRASAFWGIFFWLAGGTKPHRSAKSGFVSRAMRSLEVMALFVAAMAAGRVGRVLVVRAVPHGTIAIALGRVWGCPIYLQLTGDDLFPGRFGTRTLHLLRTALDGAHSVACPTVLLQQALAKLHGASQGKVRPLAPWVRLFPSAGENLREDSRDHLELSPDSFVLVTVGRLVAWKGVDTLLLTMAELKQEHPELVLLVVGDGPQRKDLEMASEGLGLGSCVRFLGEVDELERILAAADLLIQAPRMVPETGQVEGAAMAALEAGLRGMPLILGRSGAGAEYFVHEQSALLVHPPTDSRAYGLAIKRILAEPELGRQLGENARATLEPVLRPSEQEARLRSWIGTPDGI